MCYKQLFLIDDWFYHLPSSERGPFKIPDRASQRLILRNKIKTRCAPKSSAFEAHFAILCAVLSLAVLIDYSIVPDDKKKV